MLVHHSRDCKGHSQFCSRSSLAVSNDMKPISHYLRLWICVSVQVTHKWNHADSRNQGWALKRRSRSCSWCWWSSPVPQLQFCQRKQRKQSHTKVACAVDWILKAHRVIMDRCRHANPLKTKILCKLSWVHSHKHKMSRSDPDLNLTVICKIAVNNPSEITKAAETKPCYGNEGKEVKVSSDEKLIISPAGVIHHKMHNRDPEYAGLFKVSNG